MEVQACELGKQKDNEKVSKFRLAQASFKRGKYQIKKG
jgi:hypothetical protein